MATEFQMPKLGLTMEAGTILQWLVDDGAEVAAGDVVMLIETDKVETEIGCSESGVLSQLGRVGETYECGDLIGWFLERGEEPPTVAAPAAAVSSAIPAAAPAGRMEARAATTTAGARILASPNARRVAADLGVDLTLVTGSGPGGRIVSEDVERVSREPRSFGTPAAPAPRAASASGAAAATFAARQLADLLGVDLAQVPVGGTDPRVGREDVAAFVRGIVAAHYSAGSSVSPESVAADGAAAPVLQTPSDVVPLRGMRGIIASRMHASLQSMAQLTLTMDVDMSSVVADRERRMSDGAAATVPSLTDYVIAATARGLTDHPYANSQVTPDGVALLPEVHVGMAVAVEGGLMVPVVRNTPTLDLESLAAETSRLAAAARAGELQLADMEGGTFSVTALGMYGVDAFTPVINPPNTAILGVGRLRDNVAWEGERPVKRSVLTLSLTWDHRAFDGAPAAEFARAVKQHLESA